MPKYEKMTYSMYIFIFYFIINLYSIYEIMSL